MKDLIKKFVYLGVGAASITSKKAKNAVKVLIKEGAITTKQGTKLVRKMMSEANKERKKLENVLIREAKKEIKNFRKGK